MLRDCDCGTTYETKWFKKCPGCIQLRGVTEKKRKNNSDMFYNRKGKSWKTIRLTPHFSFNELTACPRSPDLQAKNREFALPFVDKLKLLAEMLEEIRVNFNVPVFINSGARCPELNTAVDGSPTSQHMLCEAVDFCVDRYDSPYETDMVCDWIRNKSGIKFGQLINEGRYGPDGYMICWIHLSLGEPFRPAEKCGQYLVNKQRM